MIRIRDAAVAGSFYPADPGALRNAVVDALRSVPPTPAAQRPWALIVPHAGYRYSGSVAASAYARLQPFAGRIRRVVLLGPSHYVAFSGVAASGAEKFRTPLGELPLERAERLPAVVAFDVAHRAEHSLEVQLPFLQTVLSSFALVPLVVGDAPADVVADVIDGLWTGPETLVVVSSDLSHYLDYDTAQQRDRQTCRAIEALHARHIGPADACGAAPVRGLLLWARRQDLRVQTLDLRNSGDTAGDRSRVVGYGAWQFSGDACRPVA